MATIFFEFGWSGQSSTSRFQGLSGGNTSRADRIASASGVSNETGVVIAGIFAALMRPEPGRVALDRRRSPPGRPDGRDRRDGQVDVLVADLALDAIARRRALRRRRRGRRERRRLPARCR